MGTSKIINEIQNGEVSDSKLFEYLMMNNAFVLSNVMKELVKRKLITTEIKRRLVEISKLMGKEHVLMGAYTIGHLALATLIQLGVIISDLDVYLNLDDFDKNIVDKMVESYHEVL